MEVDPYPARTPCLFEGCNLSAEEHHRINRGLAAENSALKAQIKAPETINLSEVPTADLLAELARRLENGR